MSPKFGVQYFWKYTLQFDLSYPASLYPNLSIIRTRSRRDFFFFVYNNYGEKGDFKLNQNSYTNSHELPYSRVYTARV